MKVDRSGDKYALIDDAMDQEMMDSGMNELKSDDYYEKHYEKVHETQLDGEALSHEIGGKLLSTEIRKAISDVSEYL